MGMRLCVSTGHMFGKVLGEAPLRLRTFHLSAKPCGFILSIEAPTGRLQGSLCGFKEPHWTALTALDLVMGTVGL